MKNFDFYEKFQFYEKSRFLWKNLIGCIKNFDIYEPFPLLCNVSIFKQNIHFYETFPFFPKKKFETFLWRQFRFSPNFRNIYFE